MGDTKSAADAASPAEGVGSDPEDVAAHGSATPTLGHDGEPQDRSASFSSTGTGKGDAGEAKEMTRTTGTQKGTSSKGETTPPSVSKAETSPAFPVLPPPLIPPVSSSGSTPPDASAEARATAGVAEEVDKITCTSSSSFSPAMLPYSVSSPASYRAHFTERTGPNGTQETSAGQRAAGEQGFLDKFLLSFSKPEDDRPQPCGRLPSRREVDDVIEFVVQRPTSGSAAVPYFFARNQGPASVASRDPRVRETAFVDMEGNACIPAMEGRSVENFLQLQQQQEQQLGGRQRHMRLSAPGVFVLFPPPERETARTPGHDSSAEQRIFGYPPFAATAFRPFETATSTPFSPPGYAPLPYSERYPQSPERGGVWRAVPRFVWEPENLPMDVRWKLQEEGRPQFADETALGIMPRREPRPQLLWRPATTREAEKVDKVVVPNAKRLLCFGHAGDEIKFCFGLLQLPPPPLKYDFVIEKKAVYCGMCETVNYVAVCRRCRMRLPTCPFCHKQSAIRHP